nr:ArsR family transcriptional regulator [Salegentibacter sp. Hel_I_6]
MKGTRSKYRLPRKQYNNSDGFKAISKILSLAESGVRLKILFLLNIENELCPCDIADILKMSVPSVSQNICLDTNCWNKRYGNLANK